MSRLPNVGGDDDTWGDLLNDFLMVSHNANGTEKSDLTPYLGKKTSSGIDNGPTFFDPTKTNWDDGSWWAVQPGTGGGTDNTTLYVGSGPGAFTTGPIVYLNAQSNNYAEIFMEGGSANGNGHIDMESYDSQTHITVKASAGQTDSLLDLKDENGVSAIKADTNQSSIDQPIATTWIGDETFSNAVIKHQVIYDHTAGRYGSFEIYAQSAGGEVYPDIFMQSRVNNLDGSNGYLASIDLTANSGEVLLLLDANKAQFVGQAVTSQTDPILELRDENGKTVAHVEPGGNLDLTHTNDNPGAGIGFNIRNSLSSLQADFYGYTDSTGKKAGVVEGIDRLDLTGYTEGVAISVFNSVPTNSQLQEARSNGLGQGVIEAYLDTANNKLKFRVLYPDGTTFKSGEVALT